MPPIIVCGDNKADTIGILCGARTDHILAQLQGATDVRILATNQIECPDRIEIFAEHNGQLEQLAISTGLYFQMNAPRVLLASVPPVDDWQLRTPTELPFGEDWEVHRFSAKTLGWLSATAKEARSASFSLYRIRIARQLQYYIQLNGKVYKIPVQVGKYLVLRKKRQHVIIYDADNCTFSVPVSYRPPLLVDRALTLCSGLIPRIENGRLIYPNVSSSIAMMAASLLRQ